MAHAVFFLLAVCLMVFAFRVKTSNCLPVKDAPPWCSLAAKMMVDRGGPLQTADIVTELDLALLPSADIDPLPSGPLPQLELPPARPEIPGTHTAGLRAPPSSI